MSATSALWPSMATETTWTPSASADFTAAVTASASAMGLTRAKRCSTPCPTVGSRGSGMTLRVSARSAAEHLDGDHGVVVGNGGSRLPVLGARRDQRVALGPVHLQAPGREPHEL